MFDVRCALFVACSLLVVGCGVGVMCVDVMNFDVYYDVLSLVAGCWLSLWVDCWSLSVSLLSTVCH